MGKSRTLDCVVIGYNEPPFDQYESLIRQYGEESEAYRDLKFSFVELDGKKLNYVDLMNYVYSLAHDDGSVDVRLRSGDLPSLAAAYLVNFLRRRGFSAEMINLFQEEKEELARFLSERPLTVAITTTLYVVNFPVIEMVQFIRQQNPEVKIVVGGPLIANHARNYHGDELAAALDDIGADVYVAEPQGELSLTQVMACWKGDGDLSKVSNVMYFDGGRLQITSKVLEQNSLDENYIDWARLSPCDLGPTLQTRTARSCAFSCAFCNYPTRAGKLTLTSLDTLEKEFDSMGARGNVQNVVFIDDTFNVPLPRFKDICRLLIKKDYGFNWFSYFRCSNSDEEAVDLMARSGCKGVFLGIESGSPEVLTAMNKRATLEKYYQGIRWLRDHQILTFGSFIIGFPTETRQTVDETMEFIETSGVDYYRTQMWYNEPGTPIHDLQEKYEIVGDGFVWRHSTMESLEAMDHIDRIFLGLRNSLWLPQWSFDFWIIPYLMGKGLTLGELKSFCGEAQKLLALGIAYVEPVERKRIEQRCRTQLIEQASRWRLTR